MDTAGVNSTAGCVTRVGQRDDVVCEALQSACYITEWFEPVSFPLAADTVRSHRTGQMRPWAMAFIYTIMCFCFECPGLLNTNDKGEAAYSDNMLIMVTFLLS